MGRVRGIRGLRLRGGGVFYYEVVLCNVYVCVYVFVVCAWWERGVCCWRFVNI